MERTKGFSKDAGRGKAKVKLERITSQHGATRNRLCMGGRSVWLGMANDLSKKLKRVWHKSNAARCSNTKKLAPVLKSC